MRKITIDREAARTVLEREWRAVLQARDGGRTNFLTPAHHHQIRAILESDEKAYRWLLVTAALAKATDPRIHYRALKKNECDLDGAYAPRGIAKEVVSPWNMDIGDRLGASTYPLAGNPIQSYSELKPEPNAVRPEVRERLVGLLEEFQEQTATGGLDESEILRAVLNEVAKLPPQRPEFEPNLAGPSYQEIVEGFHRFLSTPAGGERLMAVTAGMLETCYQGPIRDYSAGLGHANAPDSPRGAVGDVWLEGSDGVVAGAEVKHTQATRTEVDLAKDKAKRLELAQYFFVAESFSDVESVQDVARTESIDLVLVTISDLIAWLQPLSVEHREDAITNVGECLLKMSATSNSIDAWEHTIRTLSDN